MLNTFETQVGCGPEHHPMIKARFQTGLPEDMWITQVSTAFPDATFRLLTGAPVEDRVIEIGELRADDPAIIEKAVQNHPDVVAYDRLYDDDGGIVCRYEATEQRLYRFLGASSLPPEFPVIVEDGRMEFDVTGTRDQFEAVEAALTDSGSEYDLLSVVSTDGHDESLLTDRQRECLLVALRMGYFDVPRECTLEEVAAELGVNKSSVSDTIRRGAGDVLRWFMLGRESA